MKNKHTASFTTFIYRCNELYSQIQLVDAAICHLTKILSAASKINNQNTICEILECNPRTYIKLKQPVTKYSELVGLARRKESENAIRQLYGYFTHYLRDVLKELYPFQSYLISQINGEHISKQNLSYKEIIDLKDYKSIENEIVNRVFRSLENKRDTKGLIDKIQHTFTLTIGNDVKQKALCYLELRHLLVHNNGLADNAYVDAFGQYYTTNPIVVNERIRTTFSVYKNAQNAIHKLCDTMDEQLFQLINSMPQ